MKRCGQQRGFGLTELMIAATLGLLLIGAMIALLISTRAQLAHSIAAAQLQEEGRFALTRVAHEIMLAGHIDGAALAAQVSHGRLPALAGDCGHAQGGRAWTWQLQPFLEQVDNLEPAQAARDFPCLNPRNLKAGTDLLSVKRGKTIPTRARPGVAQLLHRIGGASLQSAPPGSTGAAYDYAPSILFIQPWSFRPGDRIPALCAKQLHGGSRAHWSRECLAWGIEDMQFEFAIGAPDGGTYFSATPAAADIARSYAVRIALLVRSMDGLAHYRNAYTYRIGNSTAHAPADRHPRRVMTTTVMLRNSSPMVETR